MARSRSGTALKPVLGPGGYCGMPSDNRNGHIGKRAAMSKQLRVGVVGLGIWGRNHAALYSNYSRSQLNVVCDMDEARARTLAKKYDCAWTTDVREAVKHCDAIAVATPDFAHTEVALAAIGAGKHILIEKPLATSTDEALKVWKAAEAAGIVGMVDFHLRWSPDYLLI